MQNKIFAILLFSIAFVEGATTVSYRDVLMNGVEVRAETVLQKGKETSAKFVKATQVWGDDILKWSSGFPTILAIYSNLGENISDFIHRLRHEVRSLNGEIESIRRQKDANEKELLEKKDPMKKLEIRNETPGALQRKIDALLEEIEMCELLAERIEMLRESEIEAQLGALDM